MFSAVNVSVWHATENSFLLYHQKISNGIYVLRTRIARKAKQTGGAKEWGTYARLIYKKRIFLYNGTVFINRRNQIKCLDGDLHFQLFNTCTSKFEVFRMMTFPSTSTVANLIQLNVFLRPWKNNCFQ